MKTQPLTSYGLQARDHWKEHLPRLYTQLEAEGKLHEALYEAQETTGEEMEKLYGQFHNQGLTEDQAHRQAWEIVREKYIYLPPENQEQAPTSA